MKQDLPGRSSEDRAAGEPLFLQRGARAIAGTLSRDLSNFVLVLVYYPLLWLVGVPLLLLDRRFGTRLLDRLIGLAEHLDEGS